jgi:hypothetical protein
MISIVYWLYADQHCERSYRAEHVNAQLPMLAKHCHVPYRIVCVTDMPAGLDPSITVIPAPVRGDGPVPSSDKRYPRCYRRLWNFSAEAKVLGDRILSLDIDSLLCGDITPLLEREEDLVVWRNTNGIILGGAYLLSTGTHKFVWDAFDPFVSPYELIAKSKQQSDQGWLNCILPRNIASWTEKDGMFCPKADYRPTPLPKGTRLVSFGGPEKPWMDAAKVRFPWIKAHYPEVRT